MVFEQMLTILLGTAAGVAAVLYLVKPKHSISSVSVETIPLPSISTESLSQAAPIQATASPSPVVEAPVAEVTATSSPSVSTTATDAVVAVSNDTAIVPVVGPVVSSAEPSISAASRTPLSARSHRTPRRSSAVPRAHAKPRVSGSVKAARKPPE